MLIDRVKGSPVKVGSHDRQGTSALGKGEERLLKKSQESGWGRGAHPKDGERAKSSAEPKARDVNTDKSLGSKGREPKTGKQRRWKHSNPLEFPASSYHWPLFRCNQPFIKRSNYLPINHKFGQLQMDTNVRREAVKFLLQPFLDDHRKFDLRGELSARGLHISLFKNLWQLTTPSKVLMEKLCRKEADCELSAKRKRGSVLAVMEMMAQKRSRGENVDFSLGDVGEDDGEEERKEEDNQDDSFSEETNESLTMVNESRPDDGEEGVKGILDLKMWVYNDSNLVLQELFQVDHSLDLRKTVCLVECKWDAQGSNNAIYQAAFYGCQEARKNLGNLHFGPIYLIVVCASEWTYAILDPTGTIDVLDGKLQRTSYPDFVKQENLRLKDDGTSFEELEGLLHRGTKYYQKYFKNCPDAVYPSGTYLVGTLYVVDEWYMLPNANMPCGGNAYDVHAFYEGLMRIVIGDEVLDWKMEDFQEAKRLKETIMDIEKDIFFWQ